MPALGLGTWMSAPGEVGAAVEEALRAGYRHIDCAAIYGNEAEIGEALSRCFADGLVTRDDLWITSKLWNDSHREEDVIPALEKTLVSPERPLTAIIGGAKISTKIDVVGHLSKIVDCLVIGGGMANTFLEVQGHNIGKSIAEHDMAETVEGILKEAEENNCEIVLPVDVVVAEDFKPHAPYRTVGLDEVGNREMILDIGPETVSKIESVIDRSKTLVWNGPMGVFELPPFDAGTMALAEIAAERCRDGKLLAVGGGGDTVAALNRNDLAKDFTYVSTAGGAFLEWLEGKVLPGVEVLQKSGA